MVAVWAVVLGGDLLDRVVERVEVAGGDVPERVSGLIAVDGSGGRGGARPGGDVVAVRGGRRRGGAIAGHDLGDVAVIVIGGLGDVAERRR